MTGEQCFHVAVCPVDHDQEQVLHGNILVAHCLCVIFCLGQDTVGVIGKIQVGAASAHLWITADHIGQIPAERLRVDAHLLQELADQAVIE